MSQTKTAVSGGSREPGPAPRGEVVFQIVFDFRQVEDFQDRRHIHSESPAQSLLQSVPPANRVLRRPAPGFDRTVCGGLLFVRASERHPVAARLEHRVQVVNASEVVPEFRTPRLDDERRRIQGLVPKRQKLRCPARRLQMPRMLSRSLSRPA